MSSSSPSRSPSRTSAPFPDTTLFRSGAELVGRAVYHDSCSALRECKIKDEPRVLLSHVGGLEIVEMRDQETCCGFGGTFAVKFRSEEHTSELQSRENLVCRLLLEKKK